MRIWTFLVIMVWMFTIAELVKGEEKGKMNQEISLPSEAEGWKWDGKEMKYDSKSVSERIKSRTSSSGNIGLIITPNTTRPITVKPSGKYFNQLISCSGNVGL